MKNLTWERSEDSMSGASLGKSLRRLVGVAPWRLGVLCGLGLALSAMSVRAQTVQIPPNYGAPPPAYGSTLPPTTIPPTAAAPTAGFGPGIQPFDPYAVPSTPSGFPGATALPPTSPVMPPGYAPQPTWPAPGISSPTPYAGAPYGANPYAAQQAVPYGYNPALPQTSSPLPYSRLFQDTGFRYTYLYGNGGNEVSINEIDISTTAYFPRFLGSQGALRFTPGFTFDFLSGPSAPVTSDLPAQLYAAYLDFGWAPEFSPQFGADLSVRTGVYSDFESVTTDSIRYMGTAVGVIKINPTTSLKLGASYIDRADIKLLPVAGFTWQPNAQCRWDLVFPSPRISKYCSTYQNAQVWWYVGAEYGGGSWTFDRPEDPEAGASERVDINDIRVYTGWEWHNLNRWYSYVEVGYVFNRELFYVVVPEDRVTLSNTFMLSAGVSW